MFCLDCGFAFGFVCFGVFDNSVVICELFVMLQLLLFEGVWCLCFYCASFRGCVLDIAFGVYLIGCLVILVLIAWDLVCVWMKLFACIVCVFLFLLVV